MVKFHFDTQIEQKIDYVLDGRTEQIMHSIKNIINFDICPFNPTALRCRGQRVAGRGGEQSLLASSVVITRGSDCAFIMSLLVSAAACGTRVTALT